MNEKTKKRKTLLKKLVIFSQIGYNIYDIYPRFSSEIRNGALGQP